MTTMNERLLRDVLEHANLELVDAKSNSTTDVSKATLRKGTFGKILRVRNPQSGEFSIKILNGDSQWERFRFSVHL